MPTAMNLDVPLDVSIKVGTSWGTMEETTKLA
jgi:DNA polymerase I-like protein with 3'-5' exonuclease and polymerase domains